MSSSTPPSDPVPPGWLLEPPMTLPNAEHPVTPLEALLRSRRYAVSQATFCATILLVHVIASWVTEARHRRKIVIPEGEVSSVPRKETRRTYLYALFSVSVTLWILCVRIAMKEAKLGIWQSMSYHEVVASALFFQFSLYSCVRFAHRGFTFGECALVSFGATILFMELMNITLAKLFPAVTPYIKTFRLPTPLLIYQIALIPGSLLTGFLLSPLLYLSRHIAQRPVRRMRYPEEKMKHRRLLALGFYVGTLLIVGGLIGIWAQWCLDGRNPWVYLALFLLAGENKWTRPALVAYWGLLISLSVAGWTRQLARSRRWRQWAIGGRAPGSVQLNAGLVDGIVVPTSPRHDTAGIAPAAVVPNGQGTAGHNVHPQAPVADANGGPRAAATAEMGDPSSSASATPPPGEGLGSYRRHLPNLPNLPNLSNLPDLPNSANFSNVATDLLDAADKHVPTLSVNARRKYFHALAVVMFVPGIAIDPAFTHLAFSGAFALFTFAEYVRYFALYPFGAAVHLFLNEFLDSKDSGTAILSHFYLLTGCANSLWFESPTRLPQFTGTLVLGVGDALASIVGKRLGRFRWSAANPKTVEGSAGFVLSVCACAGLLRACGLVEPFEMGRFAVAAALAGCLEAFSVQNDNLTLPLYMWAMVVLLDVVRA
ncbi:uncharacterized protein BXZ73DRAFT_38502 [Epithele typhae]|uniref:uncharacterized protein n=1 Tax=Epithele typhae TaxID=378194 RepID=UPI0020076A77|nr:uncharacterized protein BXZ73DRAFT_38502 [Epithele typhae]KAH9945311.1 hypothetical protein BXZ73DRAFT_38502 [Epithele typhae]